MTTRRTAKSSARQSSRIARTISALAVSAVAGSGLIAGLSGTAHAQTRSTARNYTFETLDNQADVTFNQLLGINSAGVIAGYDGSGAAGHPNKGYTVSMPYSQASYKDENFPGSAQTQVIGINKYGDTAGFWVDGNGANHGFVEWNGVFTSVDNPRGSKAAPPVTQLLGINNSGIAVGFYNDAAGSSHPFKYNQATGKFTSIKLPNATSAQATGINSRGDVVGMATSATGSVQGWLLIGNRLTEFEFPGSGNTQALGVNDTDHIVGSYVDGTGAMHGFVLTSPTKRSSWQSIDDPNGVGTTVVNGLNNAGHLVGFYVDNAGNTDGFLAQ